MADRSLQFLRNVPPALKAGLANEALTRGSNMNSVAVGILATAYDVEVEAEEPRKTTPSPDGTDMMLRLASTELRVALRLAAAMHDWSVPREVVWTLCLHYGLTPPEQPPVEAASTAA